VVELGCNIKAKKEKVNYRGVRLRPGPSLNYRASNVSESGHQPQVQMELQSSVAVFWTLCTVMITTYLGKDRMG
jgi:hypothetical protein